MAQVEDDPHQLVQGFPRMVGDGYTPHDDRSIREDLQDFLIEFAADRLIVRFGLDSVFRQGDFVEGIFLSIGPSLRTLNRDGSTAPG
jgi:hypothetical protein